MTFGHIELLSAAIKQNIEMIYLLLFMTASSDLLSRQSEPRRRAAGLLRVGARGRLLAGHDGRGVQDEGRYTGSSLDLLILLLMQRSLGTGG